VKSQVQTLADLRLPICDCQRLCYFLPLKNQKSKIQKSLDSVHCIKKIFALSVDSHAELLTLKPQSFF
jgi:hypothetical protein